MNGNRGTDENQGTGAKVNKVAGLQEAVAGLVNDGNSVALEGFTHLIPTAAGHGIIRQEATVEGAREATGSELRARTAAARKEAAG